jgi:hypothetical protein
MKYMSQLGYQIGDDGIDTYGVNHNDFTINDELRYQTARIDRENQLINSYNNMGIKDNYPIYTTNFWGSTSDNNYGFGNMNIREAIDNHAGINQSPLPVLNLNQNPMQPNVPNSVENNLSIEGLKQYNYYNPITSLYNFGQRIGEGIADAKLAYDYWQKMRQTGRRLVNTLGAGQGVGIDNYYHALLQCELAKISPFSQNLGLKLGYAKEYLMDYPMKSFIDKMEHNKIVGDGRKDLQNNIYGSNLGSDNPNISCERLLDDKRTENMRKLGIK